jgi:hypothetical protein
MKKISSIVVILIFVFVLSGCTETEPIFCGAGTTLEDGVCVAVDVDTQGDLQNESVVCTNETGLHSVRGGSPTTISEWLNWTFIGGHLVRDPDNAWIIDYGAAVFDVHTTSQNAWEGSFTQSGMFLTEGCEYTFHFTLKTESSSVKPDVIVFGETTSGISFFEETVDLELSSTTYHFTVVPTSSDYISTGVYFAGSRGKVVIEEIEIERSPIGTYTNQ